MMSETSEMNGKSTRLTVRPIVIERGKSGPKPGSKTKGTTRGRGELQALVGAILVRRPDATPQFVAEQIGISVANARMSIGRYRNNRKKNSKKVSKVSKMATKAKKKRVKKPFIAKGSAAARLFQEGLPSTSNEKNFVALIGFIGVLRAQELLAWEEDRLTRALGEVEA